MQRLIQFAVCGHSSADRNPYEATSDAITQRILLTINTRPLSIQEISREIGINESEVIQHLESLERCGLLKKTRKEDNVLYQPSFAILTRRDQERLQLLVRRLSDSLVSVVTDLLPEIRRELKEIECVKAGYNFPDLEYISLGAYAFDYDGLEVLRDEGLLTVAKDMPGGKYVFTGLEVGLENLREAWRWGHISKYGRYTFSSHGKLPPKKGRRSLPDLAWFWAYIVEDDKERENIERKIVHYGELLYKLLEGPVTLDELTKELQLHKGELIIDLTLLEELDYVFSYTEHRRETKFGLNRPALLPEDCELIHRLSKRITKEFLERSLRTTYRELENTYEQTSPAKNGIDMKEAFNPIYHSIFEKALGGLIASEIIAKPPLRRDGGQYSPWIAIESNQGQP